MSATTIQDGRACEAALKAGLLASARSARGREVAITPTLQKIMDRPIHGDHPGWGIND